MAVKVVFGLRVNSHDLYSQLQSSYNYYKNIRMGL